MIELAVRSGAYQNASEVLDQAFEIIREQLDLEDWMLGQREEVAAHIAVGFAQAERGESIEADAVVEILRQRRAGRLNRLRKNSDPGVAPDFSPGKRAFKPA